MAAPTSRATLIDYAKRKLGDPVIEINIDDDQLEVGISRFENRVDGFNYANLFVPGRN